MAAAPENAQADYYAIHFGVIAHPTSAWVAQQMRETFPWDTTGIQYLIRDRDSIYGPEFRKTVKTMGMIPLSLITDTWNPGVAGQGSYTLDVGGKRIPGFTASIDDGVVLWRRALRLGVDHRHDQGEVSAGGRADDSEDVGRGEALIT